MFHGAFDAVQRTEAASPWSERRVPRLSSLREIKDFPLAVRTLRVLTTLPDYVRQAARIHRILATSRESFALSNDLAIFHRRFCRAGSAGPCKKVGVQWTRK